MTFVITQACCNDASCVPVCPVQCIRPRPGDRDFLTALQLYIEFTNRGGDRNVKLLETLIRLRDEKAKLLGYKTWADYAIEPRMAKTPENVKKFLTRVKDAVKAPANAPGRASAVGSPSIRSAATRCS